MKTLIASASVIAMLAGTMQQIAPVAFHNMLIALQHVVSVVLSVL